MHYGVRLKMRIDFIEVSPRTGLAISLVMILAGALFVGWQFQRISTELSSYQWKQTTGIVEHSKFYLTKEYTNSRISTIYHGELSYCYNVNSKEYKGSRYDSKGNMSTGLKSEASELEESINNSEISVFYNPSDPSKSVLKNGLSEDTLVRLCFSAFLIIVGSICLFYQGKRFGNAKEDI